MATTRARRAGQRLRGARARLAGTRVVSGPGVLPKVVAARSVPPLEEYTSLLPSGPGRVVALIADSGQRDQVKSWLSYFAGDRCHVISATAAPEWSLETSDVPHHPAGSVGEQSSELKLIGPVDVLVNLIDAGDQEHLQMWRRYFFHVAKGGAYVLDQRAKGAKMFPTALTSWLGALTDPARPDEPAKLGRTHAEYIGSVEGLVVTRDLVILTKRHQHFLKLRHSDANKILASREPDLHVEVLQSMPRGVLTSKATVTVHESWTEIEHIPEEIPYPQLFLRHYTGRIASLGSAVFYSGDSILPDSFRHHLAADATTPRLSSVSPSFARVPPHNRPSKTMAGNYYNLDSTYSGHFGHLTTEVLSLLWGWDRAKAEIPDLKALIHINHENQRDPKLERRLFTAYGIPEQDIVCATKPVFLESLVSATPMWHNADPHYVHPGMLDVWRRLTDGLIDPAAPQYDKIFVSRGRRLKHRLCRNADEVERFFADRGFTVIYPEQYDLGQQVAIFAGATTIAGFGGSGLFNIMHARQMKTLIILSHEAYTARNEHLFSALLGPAVHYFWSAADIAHPPGGWSQEAFYSDWDFDFARNETDLEDVLALT